MGRPKKESESIVPLHLVQKIEIKEVSWLKPYERNSRTHSETQLDQIAASVAEFGFIDPILVKGDGTIVAGHGRLEAVTTRLDFKEVPVIVLDHLTDTQARALVIAHNAISDAAGWDDQVRAQELFEMERAGYDITLTGYDQDEIDLMLEDLRDISLEDEDEEEGDEQEYEVPEVPVTALGDVWILGRHKIICGNSYGDEAYKQLFGDKRPDAIFIDPPYGINIDGQKESKAKNPKHNRKKHEKKNWDSERPPAEFFERILSLDIQTIIFGGNYFADLLPPQRGYIYWDKGQDGLTMSDGELAWSNIDMPLRAVTCNRGAIGDSIHPTQKPLKVVEFSLNCFKHKSKIVFDCFLGSGSTLIACENTKRTCYGIELDPGYVDSIIDRWQSETGKRAVLESTNRTFENMKRIRLDG